MTRSVGHFRTLTLGHALALALGAGWWVSAAAHAGTGRLLSKWMDHAPSIDGRVTTGDWDGAVMGVIGPGLALAFGNDARTLYVGVFDNGNTAVGPGDFVLLHFDDEGGSGQVHDDGAWLNAGCQANPGAGEGNLLFAADGSVSYQEIVAPSFGCSALAIPGRTGFATGDSAQGSIFEFAIPLDGPAPLRLLRGERFGLRLQIYRNGVNVGCLPECSAGPLPADYQNFVLASIGCNTGVLNLDSGLPLDWTPHHTYSGPGGWVASGPSGDPVFCDEPQQGPGGSAACVSDYDYPLPQLESYLDAPIAVTGFTTASIRFLGTLVQGHPSAFLSLLTYSGAAFRDNPMTWQQSHTTESVILELALDQAPYGDGFQPDRLSWYHSPWLAGGVEGGYAQVDDFELRCGPLLFLDDFDSGLSTHWSTTAP
jgi:hypothetical protein